jgi:GMP synthase (glutamine-hydrolysing)
MRVLAFRHAEGEDLGSIRPILEDHGVQVECVDLYAGARLPDTARAAGLILMGGAMCANDDLGFLGRELDLIRDAAGRGQPVFGVCLGAQLIAKALGGSVYPHPVPETGWSHIQLTECAGSDPIFSRLANMVQVFQLHHDTFALPPGAVSLARSEACERQAFRVGQNIYAVQFHPEMTPQMCREWSDVLGIPPWPTPPGAYPALAATCETLIKGWRGLLGHGR